MRPITVTVTGGGAAITVPLDHYGPGRLTVAGAIASGTPTWNVEMTFDDIQDSAITPVWFAAHASLTGETAANYAYLESHPTALKFTATGSGTVRARVIAP